MPLSDLDGFLTGIAIGPELVMPSEWLEVIWGGEEPDYADLAEAQAVLGAIMGRYNEILRTLRETPDQFDPIFLESPDGQIVIASDWAAGFMDAVQLREAAWQPLVKSHEGHLYLTPITILATPDEELPKALKTAMDEGNIWNRLHESIPEAVAAIDTFWKKRRGVPTKASSRIGRNDPCPCGSGRKHKKCCGVN